MTQLLEQLLKVPTSDRLAFISKCSAQEALDLLYDWRGLWARPEQLPPNGDWSTWLICAGRGWGKSRTGAEWVNEKALAQPCRIHLVARTAADIRDVMVEGNSGILASSHPFKRPTWNPSNRRLSWPNGSTAITFSAEEPNALRGPQAAYAWCDELAAWSYAQETWDQLQFGLRLGKQPQVCVTTTPRPTPLIRALIDDPKTVVVKGSTYDNADYLAASFLEQLQDKYEGTRLGRQELFAEILDDNPGALWKREQIVSLRVRSAPEMKRIVVAVDPAITRNAQSCECGIVVVGCGKDGHGYVLDDRSVIASPAEWGREVVKAYHDWEADRVVAETNLGGEVVRSLLITVDPGIPYKGVRAARGKDIRAEPVAALYEQGRVHHVGEFPELEDQLVCWDPASTPDRRHRASVRETEAQGPMQGAKGRARTASDRLDALVWGITELMVEPIVEPPKLDDFKSFKAPKMRF